MRRRPGVGGLKRNHAAKEKFKKVGEQLEETKMSHIAAQLAIFKENLERFAQKHKREINENPVFRRQFQEMCTKVGVDPLASHKGFWAELLGVGDFYYELAVQIVEICLSTRAQNGGLMTLDELLWRVQTSRGRHHQAVSRDDVVRAIQKVASLGNGFQLLTIGRKQMVVSVPIELNQDHGVVLERAQGNNGWVSVPKLQEWSNGWTEERAHKVLDLMMDEGMVWIDKQSKPYPTYWFPSLVLNNSGAEEEDELKAS